VEPTDKILELARAIVLREQDVAAREQDVVRRKQELDARQRELAARKVDLEQLKLRFAEVASGRDVQTENADAFPRPLPPHPALARTSPTVAERVLSVLEMEPRAFSPPELLNLLELPPGIDTLRTTLSKLEKRGLISRPFPGHYCANQHVQTVLKASAG